MLFCEVGLWYDKFYLLGICCMQLEPYGSIHIDWFSSVPPGISYILPHYMVCWWATMIMNCSTPSDLFNMLIINYNTTGNLFDVYLPWTDKFIFFKILHKNALYCQFVTDVMTRLMLRPGYSRKTRSIPRLLMHWKYFPDDTYSHLWFRWVMSHTLLQASITLIKPFRRTQITLILTLLSHKNPFENACIMSPLRGIQANGLTHWGWKEMTNIFQMPFFKVFFVRRSDHVEWNLTEACSWLSNSNN